MRVHAGVDEVGLSAVSVATHSELLSGRSVIVAKCSPLLSEKAHLRDVSCMIDKVMCGEQTKQYVHINADQPQVKCTPYELAVRTYTPGSTGTLTCACAYACMAMIDMPPVATTAPAANEDNCACADMSDLDELLRKKGWVHEYITHVSCLHCVCTRN